MMEPFVTLHDDLVNGKPCCSIPDDQDECDDLLLGCLVRNFRWRGLDEPTKDAVQRYSGSIIDLEDNLGGMKLMTLRSHDEFEDCYKNLQKRGMDVRRVPCIGKRSEAVVLLPQQKEHMGRQAVKSGLQSSTIMEHHRAKRTKLDDTVGPQMITVEEDGDLHLVVDGTGLPEPKTYVVCSRALARHSPVLKAMLFGAFAEARRPTDGSQWVVKVSEDNHKQFPVFLSIVHGCFQDVPKELDVQDLGALLVIVDKYDALPIIRPWVKGWLETPRERWAAEGYSSNLVCYAWMTGHRAIFEKEARNTVYAEKLEPDFRFVDHEALRPPGLFEFLEKLRGDVFQAIMKPYLHIYLGLTTGEPRAEARGLGKCTRQPHFSSFACESVMLGSLLLGIRYSRLKLTLNDLKYHKELNGLKNLKKKLNDIKIMTHKQHEACERLLNTRRQDSLQYEDKLVTGAEIVRHEHLEHLQSQAKKTGLDEDNQAGGVKH
ncbi:Nuclear pore protein-like protein [Colletotrichum asianum]